MKAPHRFLREKLTWIGEGSVELTVNQHRLPFATRWEVERDPSGLVVCSQVVEIEGMGQTMMNRYTFKEGTEDTFHVSLQNEVVGKVEGKGAVDGQSLVWEFRCPEKGFEGFEIYKQVEADYYRFHGEYTGGDDARTIIEGFIREKTS